MRDAMITALEASWELDPVLMEDNLWKRIEENTEKIKTNVCLTNNAENDNL